MRRLTPLCHPPGAVLIASGVRETTYLAAWFTVYALLSILSSAGFIAAAFMLNILEHSNPLLVLIFVVIASWSMLCLGLAQSAFLSRQRRSARLLGLARMLLVLIAAPIAVLVPSVNPTAAAVCAVIVPQIVACLGWDQILLLESRQVR